MHFEKVTCPKIATISWRCCNIQFLAFWLQSKHTLLHSVCGCLCQAYSSPLVTQIYRPYTREEGVDWRKCFNSPLSTQALIQIMWPTLVLREREKERIEPYLEYIQWLCGSQTWLALFESLLQFKWNLAASPWERPLGCQQSTPKPPLYPSIH